jgi:hypothetical protein
MVDIKSIEVLIADRAQIQGRLTGEESKLLAEKGKLNLEIDSAVELVRIWSSGLPGEKIEATNADIARHTSILNWAIAEGNTSVATVQQNMIEIYRKQLSVLIDSSGSEGCAPSLAGARGNLETVLSKMSQMISSLQIVQKQLSEVELELLEYRQVKTVLSASLDLSTCV